MFKFRLFDSYILNKIIMINYVVQINRFLHKYLEDKFLSSLLCTS